VGRPEDGGTIRARDRAEELDGVSVDVRLDLGAEVALVLHDPGDDQSPPNSPGDLDRCGRALVRMDAAEEDQRVAAVAEREVVNVDAVVDRGRMDTYAHVSL
jgi:hypothetical protein